MKKYIAILLFTLVTCNSFAQNDPDIFLKNIFYTIQNKDSAGFIRENISYGAIKTIVTGYAVGELNNDSINNAPDITNSIYSNYLMQKRYLPVCNKADSFGIHLSDAEYVVGTYQIIKDTGTFFPSLKGAIFFKYAGKYYQIAINEALLINQIWKIGSLGELTFIQDNSAFTNKPKRISAFHSLDTAIKVIYEVKLIDVKSDIHEPPPPPPPPPPKKLR